MSERTALRGNWSQHDRRDPYIRGRANRDGGIEAGAKRRLADEYDAAQERELSGQTFTRDVENDDCRRNN
jgi:hypothetical protein